MTSPTTEHTSTSSTGTSSGLLAAALTHAQRGWHVFPLRPGSKRPAVTAWPDRATTEPDRITRCWTPGPGNPARWGIGLATGPSGLVVVDLDRDKTDPGAVTGADHLAALTSQHQAGHGGSRLATFTVRTASGGAHLYYLAPDGVALRNTAGRLAPLVDTRGIGGYVVAPGSSVDGRPYVVTDDRDPVPLPSWLAALLDPSAANTATRTSPVPAVLRPAQLDASTRAARFLAAAVGGETARVLAARPGGRNHALNAAAYNLGQLVGAGLLGADDVAGVLTGPALSTGLSEHETAATIASGVAAGTRNPRTGTARPGVAA